jgi:hypothetical protein
VKEEEIFNLKGSGRSIPLAVSRRWRQHPSVALRSAVRGCNDGLQGRLQAGLAGLAGPRPSATRWCHTGNGAQRLWASCMTKGHDREQSTPHVLREPTPSIPTDHSGSRYPCPRVSSVLLLLGLTSMFPEVSVRFRIMVLVAGLITQVITVIERVGGEKIQQTDACTVRWVRG